MLSRLGVGKARRFFFRVEIGHPVIFKGFPQFETFLFVFVGS